MPADSAPAQHPARRAVATWLLACCALVFAMVVLGGVTRLTHSGLSIVEWQPLIGAVPPLSETDWAALFEKYKRTPEYEQVNRGMSMAEFKGIFWLEYFHRLLGRAIGIVFLAPFLWFLLRRRLDARLAWRLGGVFLLGGLQGALGWYMVASGLVAEPRVSHFRLTAHLALAFLIYAAMLWIALDLIAPRGTRAQAPASPGLRGHAAAITGLVVMMVLTGGLVAGIRAGKAYNTFPLMNGDLVPPEIFMLDPWISNFFYNMATVQFDHRLFAWALAVAVPAFWGRVLTSDTGRTVRLLAHLLIAAFAAQFALGVATLLAGVPVALGAAHQGGAVLVFTLALALNHALRAQEGDGYRASRTL